MTGTLGHYYGGLKKLSSLYQFAKAVGRTKLLGPLKSSLITRFEQVQSYFSVDDKLDSVNKAGSCHNSPGTKS